MGEVWRGLDTDTDRIVALKLLPAALATDPTFVQRFRREAYAAAKLNNPHIIPIHNYGEIDGRLYVDMRLVEGRDLQELLSEGPLVPSRAVGIVEQVAKALNSAHKSGVVHRDVKPSNILVDEDDFAYLIDFGIARAADATDLTGTGATLGTWAYMAPERFRMGGADAKVDVYALACVLHQCLTGNSAFPGTSLPEQMHAHIYLDRPRPSHQRPGLPTGFDEVIARGMAIDPDKRYATTTKLAAAARDVITVTVPLTNTTPAPGKPSSVGITKSNSSKADPAKPSTAKSRANTAVPNASPATGPSKASKASPSKGPRKATPTQGRRPAFPPDEARKFAPGPTRTSAGASSKTWSQVKRPRDFSSDKPANAAAKSSNARSRFLQRIALIAATIAAVAALTWADSQEDHPDKPAHTTTSAPVSTASPALPAGSPAIAKTDVQTTIAISGNQLVSGFREVYNSPDRRLSLCGEPSPAAVTADVYLCEPYAEGASVCWTAAPTSILCLDDPWSKGLRRYTYTTPLHQVYPEDNPKPYALLLDDGTRCRLMVGGTRWVRPDGYRQAYSCGIKMGSDLSVMVPSDSNPINRSSPLWTVMVGVNDSALETHSVATAWFAGAEGDG